MVSLLKALVLLIRPPCVPTIPLRIIVEVFLVLCVNVTQLLVDLLVSFGGARVPRTLVEVLAVLYCHL